MRTPDAFFHQLLVGHCIVNQQVRSEDHRYQCRTHERKKRESTTKKTKCFESENRSRRYQCHMDKMAGTFSVQGCREELHTNGCQPLFFVDVMRTFIDMEEHGDYFLMCGPLANWKTHLLVRHVDLESLHIRGVRTFLPTPSQCRPSWFEARAGSKMFERGWTSWEVRTARQMRRQD